jgi:hypothetical protein
MSSSMAAVEPIGATKFLPLLADQRCNGGRLSNGGPNRVLSLVGAPVCKFIYIRAWSYGELIKLIARTGQSGHLEAGLCCFWQPECRHTAGC